MSEESNEGGRRPSILDAFTKEAEEKKAEQEDQAKADEAAAEEAEPAAVGERAIPDSADDEADEAFDAAASLVKPAAAVGDDENLEADADKDKQDALDALDSLLAQRGTHSVEDSPIADPRLAERETVEMDAVGDGETQDEGEALEAEGDEAAEGEAAADEGGQPKRNPAKIAMLVIGGIAAAAILVLIGTSIGTMAAQQTIEARNIESTQTVTNSSTHEQSADSNAQKAEDATLAPAQDGSSATAANGTAQAVCEHDWKPEAETKHHDAVTKEVTIPGSTYTETEYHTLCNVCHEQIDGKTAEHKAATGHVGYTTNVPVKVTKQNPDTTQTVEVEAAYDEKVWTKEKCSKCGAEREVGEHSEKVE